MEKKVQSPLKKFVVEKGGNPRGKAISKDDIKQALRDIAEWFKGHAKNYFKTLSGTKGANEEEIKKLEAEIGMKLPISLQALLSVYNGNLQILDTYLTIPINEISALTLALKKDPKWKASLIPFAKNTEEDYLCMEASGGSDGGIFTWSKEEGLSEQTAVSIGAYLESIRDMLLLCLLYTSPSPRDLSTSRMPSSA
eukprot:TRINITY_DN299_c0_g3_i2.p2 TRINITY_DN299_c0_g3~~TRINITY_DN299_c0_g3_i2.p2  ORF type:complete len:196 (-),score=85.34 TRINITY_DN299_c0_g3_i2:18-605(-)